MDEKVFDLLGKLYDEMQTMKADMQEMKANMATKGDIANMATKDDIANMATKQDIVRLENKMDSHHKVLYDGYKQNAENITAIKDQIDNLTHKVENQEIKLQVLKSVK